jgi:hypothetical protein
MQFTPPSPFALTAPSNGTGNASHLSTGVTQGYVLAALAGNDQNDGETWTAQVCAVLACDEADARRCLQYTVPSNGTGGGGRLASLLLKMKKGATGDTYVVPETVATSAGEEQVLLRPISFRAATAMVERSTETERGSSSSASSSSSSSAGTFAFSSGRPSPSAGLSAGPFAGGNGTARTAPALRVNLSSGALALTSAVLYGRRFAADTLPYDCPAKAGGEGQWRGT